MELVIKLYSDKPSKIGIKYIYEYLAVREYEELIRKFSTGSAIMKIEFTRDHKLTLTLQSDSTGAKQEYKALEYKIDQIKRLQAYFDPNSGTEFVHIFPKSNQLLIARPFKKAEFIKVSSLDFISAAGALYS